MNEQRIQAYRNLIQQLLTCPNGEENQILNQAIELVDEGFVQVCEQVAQQLQQAGEENQAGFLRNLVQQVSAFLNPQPSGGGGESRETPPNATEEDYFNFLMEVLKTTSDWARTQTILGIAYSERIQGERGQNLELAIAAYQAALQVYTRDAFPEKWAMTQGILGIAYNERIQGEPRQNLELAIACYQDALQVYTPDAFPEKWAITQIILGNAYSERIQGERGQNLELAIACYQAALQVYTRDAFPEDWAGTQNNLGNAYSNRIQGERGQNLELAIASYQAALQVYTRDAFPEKWAMTQVNLADALVDYFECFAQDSHLHQAIAIYRKVLDSYQQVSLTLDQASILYKLGKALSRQGSYSQAIQSLEQVRTLLEKPADLWLLALTFFELARLYHRLHRLEKARLYFKDTLRLFRRLGDQDSIADVMIELGNLQLQLGQIQSAKHYLEEARGYYQAKGNPERIEQIDWLLSLLGEPREAIARG